SHSIEEFLDLAFGEVGLDWRDHVDIDPRYFRPSEPTLLIGNAAKARTKLGWVASTDLRELARIMVAHDLEVALEEQKDPRAERRRDAKRSG
ncbi:MAG: GDP-mannose 4,6-dehydratase, partial [Pirellulaceae bacterium]